MLDFTKLKDPVYLSELRRKREEDDKKQEQARASLLQSISACLDAEDRLSGAQSSFVRSLHHQVVLRFAVPSEKQLNWLNSIVDSLTVKPASPNNVAHQGGLGPDTIVVVTTTIFDESKGKNVLVASHGVDSNTMRSVTLPSEHPSALGAVFDEGLGEYVLRSKPAPGRIFKKTNEPSASKPASPSGVPVRKSMFRR
jgi:hypothetical protein